MNNKGTEQVLSVYWFAILIIVAVGVSAMVFTFYGHPYDVRELEANILMNKIADCVSKEGIIPKQITQNGNLEAFDIERDCGLNFNTPDIPGEHKQYYVRITFKDMNENEVFPPKEGGNNNLRSLCLGTETAEALPTCINGKIFALDSSGRQYSIEILTGVLKTIKNVKI